ISSTANFMVLGLAPLLLAAVVVLYGMIRHWLVTRYGSLLRMRRAPDETDRLWRIVRGALFAFLSASAFVFILYITLRAAHVLTLRFEKLFSAFGDLVIFTVLVAAMIVVLRNQPGLGDQTRGELYFRWVTPLVPLIWGILGIAITALLLGYIALASFVTEQFIDTAYLIAGLLLLHHLSEAVVVSSLDAKSRVGQALRRMTGLGSRGAARLGLLLRTVIDLMLVFFGLPLLLLKWTVTWIDFGSWFNAALIGFKIGTVTI